MIPLHLVDLEPTEESHALKAKRLGAEARAAGRELSDAWLRLIDRLHDACNDVEKEETTLPGIREIARTLRRELISAGLNATAILERSK